MNIRIAEEKDFNVVKKIARETIMEIYPMYYPHGAVLFFAEHHSDENIMNMFVRLYLRPVILS